MRTLSCLAAAALMTGCASAPMGPVGVPHASGPRQSLEALKADCDHGNARACNNLGADYATGHDTAMNAASAAQLFAKSCDHWCTVSACTPVAAPARTSAIA